MHPAAAAVEAQLLELVEGYHRLLKLHEGEGRGIKPFQRTSSVRVRDKQRSAVTDGVTDRHHRYASPTDGVAAPRGPCTSSRGAGASPLRRMPPPVQGNDNPRWLATEAARRCVPPGSHTAASRHHDPLSESYLPKPRAASSGVAPRRRAKNSGSSDSFIRSQMHTCRPWGGGKNCRGSTIGCAACNGAASRQHVRFLQREALHKSNVRRALAEGVLAMPRTTAKPICTRRSLD